MQEESKTQAPTVQYQMVRLQDTTKENTEKDLSVEKACAIINRDGELVKEMCKDTRALDDKIRMGNKRNEYGQCREKLNIMEEGRNESSLKYLLVAWTKMLLSALIWDMECS
ncbi:hypothetical protein SUGI_0095170 [Cryptomeria japonica]|nr:hypothetical protein SUGI_0095170 [Cryptomeria japonica]